MTKFRWRDSPAVVVAASRANWLAVVLLATGFALRIATLLAYRPAIFYIDTVRYLYQAQGSDPVGYRIPLRLILALGNLNMVAAVQHVLGLAIAATIYVVLLRLGTPRWLAALAMAPVLLDAYQLQIEQMIMPDIWFEALIAAGIAVLLSAPAASRRGGTTGRSAPPLGGPALTAVVIAGLIFGASATIRQVGQILVVPALAYLVVLRDGWRRALIRVSVLTAAFVLPILAYSTVSYLVTGHFWLSHSGATSAYGRMAAAADCTTLRLPPTERALCPTAAQRALGPDGLEHSPSSPRVPYYTGPLSAQASRLVADFTHRVLVQQPQRVAAAVASDAVKLFALTRTTSPGDTPISRWQFQTSYPYLSPHATRPTVLAATARFGGGSPKVWRPVAAFLRAYQRDGGFTPGPLLALCVLAGLAGSALTVVGRRARLAADPVRHQLALGCLLFFGCAAAVLLMSDVFEFSWRYQLPALVTLPPAGALAVAAFARRPPVSQGQDPALAESSEQVSLRD